MIYEAPPTWFLVGLGIALFVTWGLLIWLIVKGISQS